MVRGLIAGVLAWLDYPVEWIFGALLFDYCVKSSLLGLRFRRGRWRKIVL